MTATANLSAPSLQQLAPHVTSKIKDGELAKAQMGLLGAGLVLIGIAWATGGSSFYFSYLVGYMGLLGICLGALFFTMLHHITRAGWSAPLLRLAENTMWVLPFMLLLFVPILVGFDTLYEHWAKADLTKDAVLAGKQVWLNKPFFFVRVAIYFAIWIGLGWFFRSNSIKQDEKGDPVISLKLARFAAPGMLLFALSLTFASFDWIMSLDPHWFSTIFGLTYFAGAFMGFLAFIILMARWLGAQGYLRDAVTVEHYHDLGKLMFTFMVFWTYTNFSQYMLIWYANLPEETHWFWVRAHGGWGAVGTILVVGHFFVPFAFLMSRHVKRNRIALSAGAIAMLVIHCIDMQYLILPTADHGHAAAGHGEAAHGAGEAAAGVSGFSHQFGEYLHQVHWADFGCFLGMLAIVTALTILNVRKTNLIAMRDPRLAEGLHFQNQ
ncbi:MAG TPA: quinol:cytochrome C oxidoreductase [Planctomycetota bacterium]|nr:quinol:cytochrome C oxidoreductase [Planctomycetota bacterium]